MATSAVTPDNDAVVEQLSSRHRRSVCSRQSPILNRCLYGGGSRVCIPALTEWKADLRPGGKWQTDGVEAEGTNFRVEGEYLEVDPPSLLVYTWIASYAATTMKTVVRWELERR